MFAVQKPFSVFDYETHNNSTQILSKSHLHNQNVLQKDQSDSQKDQWRALLYAVMIFHKWKNKPWQYFSMLNYKTNGGNIVSTPSSDLIKEAEKLEKYSHRVKTEDSAHTIRRQPQEKHFAENHHTYVKILNYSNTRSSSLNTASISILSLFFNKTGRSFCWQCDICFVRKRRWPTAGPITLTGSGIVGYLHHSPPGKAGSFTLPFTLHAPAGPLATAYTCMIMKCHILHSNCILDFKRAKKKEALVK